MEMLKIRLRFTPSYHPRGNYTERVNRFIGESLAGPWCRKPSSSCASSRSTTRSPTTTCAPTSTRPTRSRSAWPPATPSPGACSGASVLVVVITGVDAVVSGVEVVWTSDAAKAGTLCPLAGPAPVAPPPFSPTLPSLLLSTILVGESRRRCVIPNARRRAAAKSQSQQSPPRGERDRLELEPRDQPGYLRRGWPSSGSAYHGCIHAQQMWMTR